MWGVAQREGVEPYENQRLEDGVDGDKKNSIYVKEETLW